MAKPVISDLLDRAHLARYTLGDAALEREVLDLFIGQLPQSLAALTSQVDAEGRHRAAHTIKGSARAVGATKLARLAQEAETVVSDPLQWQTVVAQIEAAVQELADVIALEPLA